MFWNPCATSLFALAALFVVLAGVTHGQPLEKGVTVRPYQFGFTIEEQQHRFEKRDERGIVMGEFGFITADGIYHVTVYATDEEGKFRILAMRNYPYESPPKTIEMIVKPKTKPVIITTTTTTTTARPIVEKKTLPKYNFNTKACSGCFLKNDIVKDTTDQDKNLGLSPELQPPTITNTIKGIVNEMIKMVSVQNVLPVATKTKTQTEPKIATNTLRTGKMLTLSQTTTGTNAPVTLKFTQQKPATKTNTNKNNPGTSSIKQPLNNPTLGYPAVSTVNQRNAPGGSSAAKTPTVTSAPNTMNTPTTITSEEIPQVDIRLSDKALAPQKPLPNAQNPIVQQNAAAVPSSGKVTKDSSTSGGAQKSGTPNAGSSPSSTNKPSSKSSSTASGDLYHFKYLLDYNGHEETGSRNGNKVGNFFSIGDDNVERTIEYIANEFGYQPRIRWRKLDAARTKPAENALKDYEFVWFRKD